MTIMQERPKNALERKRDQIVMENKEHLNRGDWGKYSKNCKRLQRISAELHRRESLRNDSWKAYV